MGVQAPSDLEGKVSLLPEEKTVHNGHFRVKKSGYKRAQIAAKKTYTILTIIESVKPRVHYFFLVDEKSRTIVKRLFSEP